MDTNEDALGGEVVPEAELCAGEDVVVLKICCETCFEDSFEPLSDALSQESLAEIVEADAFSPLCSEEHMGMFPCSWYSSVGQII